MYAELIFCCYFILCRLLLLHRSRSFPSSSSPPQPIFSGSFSCCQHILLPSRMCQTQFTCYFFVCRLLLWHPYRSFPSSSSSPQPIFSGSFSCCQHIFLPSRVCQTHSTPDISFFAGCFSCIPTGRFHHLHFLLSRSSPDLSPAANIILSSFPHVCQTHSTPDISFFAGCFSCIPIYRSFPSSSSPHSTDLLRVCLLRTTFLSPETRILNSVRLLF